MSLKSIVRELREMKDGMGSMSRRGGERKYWHRKSRSHIAPDQTPLPLLEPIQQGRWSNLPPELLLDIIRRVEESETSWPARRAVVYCASVCRSWRAHVSYLTEAAGPSRVSNTMLYQKGQSHFYIFLFYGLVPSEDESDKLLLAAKKIRRATSTDFVISLVGVDFSRASSAYVGKLRSNFLGTKFTIYDSQPPCEATVQLSSRSSRRFHSKQVSPRVPACNYSVGTISYELNVLRTRGPRRMNCAMHSILMSSIEEGGTAPTPTSFPHSFDELQTLSSPIPVLKGKDSIIDFSSTSLSEPPVVSVRGSGEPLVLKTRLLDGMSSCSAAVGPSHNVSAAEQEKVILQFGKIGKDIFTMDYRYPLSAFQAFAICLSSFDTKPACE
ncbi:hypothetical protein SLA2020_453020 [Shorea laevis]